MDTKNKRLYYLDVAKMFASFGIILAHIITPDYMIGFKIVSNGALAFFFFSSGYVCKVEKNLFVFLKKNFFGIIIPYLIVALMSVICGKIYPEFYPENVTLYSILYAIFIKCKPLIYGCGWFLVCMFVTKLIFNIILIITDNIKFKNIIYMSLIIVSSCLIEKVVDKEMAFRLGQVTFAIIFYIFGYLVSKIKLSEIFGNKFIQIIVFVITKFISLYITLKCLAYTNIADCAYGNRIVLYITMELFAIVSFVCIGKVFENIKIFAYLGKNNLWIYLLHPYVLWFIEEIYCKWKGTVARYLYNDLKEIIIIFFATYIFSVILAIAINKLVKIFVKGANF